MGLGQWLSSKIDKAKDVINDAVDYVKEKTSKVWNGITGKTTFNEAEALLGEITDRYDKAKYEYEQKMEKLNSQIEKKINTINYYKSDIYDNHFVKFTTLGNRLHNINIEGKNFLEYFDDSITSVKNMSGVRSKQELYLIDFNNLSFKEKLIGTFTLGFFTRKKAKQTLIKVQEEERRIGKEIEDMASQITKVKVILESLNNVAEYFEQLVQSYSKLLDRFEYGIKTQIQKNIFKGISLENGKLNFKLMPIAHIEEFQALFNLSIVLKQMATMGYLKEMEDEEGNLIEHKDIETANNIWYKVKELKLVSA